MLKKDKYFGLSPRIASWERDTPLENWLSLKADESDFWKRIYVLYYNVFDYKYYCGGVELIEKVIEPYKYKFISFDRSNIIRDMVYCLHRFGISFEEYCIYNFVVEELINQGAEMAALHPQSINSLRVSTFVSKGKVHINAIVLRMGLGESVVDNAGSGGIYASVDPEYGFVQTDARDYKGKHFNMHPDTGVQIVGYKLPEWAEALSLIQKIATCQEGTVLIAWDIAYSDNGCLMVEGNAVGSWDVLQSNKQIGKKAELFSYMDEYFKTNELLKADKQWRTVF